MSNLIYKSSYGATRLISASAYLSEYIITRQSKWSKLNLPDRFWMDNAYIVWTSKFRCQMRFADALLKSGFEVDCIISVLNKNQKIGSLNNKQLYKLLCEEQRIIENQRKIEYTKIEITSAEAKPQKPIGKPSKRSKLE